MDQQQTLPLTMARLDGPSVVDPAYVARFATYRQVVRAAFGMSRVTGPNTRVLQSLLAQATGAPASHVSDWLNKDKDGDPNCRDLPAKRIPLFEAHLGNTLVSQWLAMQARLTVLEGVQLMGRVAA